MVFMIGGGAALMFRSLKDYDADEKAKIQTELDDANRRLNDLKEDLDNLKAKTDKKN
jgi:hypothetical protein